jgi:hypothetical protein
MFHVPCRKEKVKRKKAKVKWRKEMRRYKVTIYVPEAIYQTAIWFLLLYRKIRYGYPFRRIKLTRGLYAKVDPEDYPRLARYKWYATSDKNNKVYAERSVWYRNKKKTQYPYASRDSLLCESKKQAIG